MARGPIATSLASYWRIATRTRQLASSSGISGTKRQESLYQPLLGRVAPNLLRPRAAARVRQIRRQDPPAGTAGLDLNALDLEEFLEAEAAALTAMARLLDAAEGRQRIEGCSVDLHLAGAHPPSDCLSPFRIGRPDATVEPVDRAVRDLSGLVLGVVRNDREHRSEDLLLGDRHVRLDVGEDSGLHEVARLQPLRRLGATGDQLGALLLALLDEPADPLLLGLGDERAQARPVLERIARRRLPGGGGRDLLGLRELLPRDQHPGVRAAGLAGVEVAVGDPVADCGLQVRVIEDHIRRLAAQ